MGKKSNNYQEKLAHVLIWVILFGSPIFMMDRSESGLDWMEIIHRIGNPTALFILFYTNYFFLVPRLFLKNKKAFYILINIVFCVLLFIGQIQWERVTTVKGRPSPSITEMFQMSKEPMPEHERSGKDIHPGKTVGKPDSIKGRHKLAMNDSVRHQRHHRQPRRAPGLMTILGIRIPFGFIFVFRDLIIYIMCIMLSITTRMSRKWRESEQALQKAEMGRVEAELKNLRSQINPHFLLNTLNNIYALIAFDQDKAQETVQELSKLLRHVLYDNQQPFVPLDSEVDFLRSYVELMKIRMPKTATITVENAVTSPNSLTVAPLLFISLVENAFKHGISATEKSFISIKMDYQKEKNALHFRIENSNFPKNETDRSGSGIGLEQVQRRLELVYPEHYKWEKGVKEGTYFSDIVILLNA